MTQHKPSIKIAARPYFQGARGLFALHNPVAPGVSEGQQELASPRLGELRALLSEFLTTIAAALGANAGFIQLLSPNAQTPQVISSIGLSADFLQDEQCVDLSCATDARAPLSGFVRSFDIGKCRAQNHCSFGEQFKYAVTAPLFGHNQRGAAIGITTLFFYAKPHTTQQLMETLVSFAKLISISLVHNRLVRENRRNEIIAERQSIANEIHDSLSPSLMYARMRTNLLMEAIRSGNETMATEYTQDLDETLEKSQKTVRQLITDFRCEFDPAGLLHALQDLARQFRKQNDIALEYTNNTADLDLPLEYEIQIYNIVHEALSNIATHSGATHARLNIGSINGNYVFTIEDNGHGGHTFNPSEGHYGMMIMRERAARIGGELKIESTEGMGTLVQLFFPYSSARSGSE